MLLCDRPTVKTYPPPPELGRWPHVSKWDRALWFRWLTLKGYTELECEQYWHDRYAYGFGIRKADGEVTWLYLPTPRQVDAHKCPAPNLLFGGAVGGAKSHWARWDLYKRCLMVPEYRALILRRYMPELERTHLRDAVREMPTFGAKLVDGEGRFPNGSLIEFGHLQDDKAVAKYLSAQYDIIVPDEGATFPSALLLEVCSRARTTKEGVTAMVRIPTNPGGANTLWLVDRYIDKSTSTEEDPYYVAAEHAYVPSKLYDNPYLMDPDGTFHTYEKRLGPIAPERRRQLLEGDWSAIGGQFFTEFSRGTHAAVRDIPKGTVFERWIDWGYNNPGVCYWVACLPDKRLYVRHEYKFQGVLAADVANEIVRQTRELSHTLGFKIQIRKSVADPSMSNKTGHWGESFAETFARRGVSSMKGDNDRVLGWGRLRHWFALAPDGFPWMEVHPSCIYALRSIPSLVSDKNKPEDVDSEGEDHAADAIRYGVMARPAPTRSYVSHSPLEGTAGAMLHRAITDQMSAGLLGAHAVRGAA